MENQSIDLSGPIEDRQKKVTSYLRHELEDATIDEILRGLIDGNGMMEITTCLDMIAQERGRRIVLVGTNKVREYPHPNVKDAPIVAGVKAVPINPGAVLEFDPPTTLSPVDQVYKGGFFKNRHKLDWRATIIGETLVDLFNLKSNSNVIDCGCAIGEYVNWLFKTAGIPAWGIEGSKAAKEFAVTERISYFDLRESLGDSNLYLGRYNLAISLEVAEHIEPEYSGIYLDNLCRLSDTILMTAAHPGQKGHGHVNCQEKGWWAAEMAIRNYGRDYNMERVWADLLRSRSNRKEVLVYAKNVMIFKAGFIGANHG